MLITTAGLLKRSVYPSGADLATYSFAMLVPAPGRFSTTTCWPRSSESFEASRRALMSTPPPGVKPTRSLTGIAASFGTRRMRNSIPGRGPVLALGRESPKLSAMRQVLPVECRSFACPLQDFHREPPGRFGDPRFPGQRRRGKPRGSLGLLPRRGDFHGHDRARLRRACDPAAPAAR